MGERFSTICHNLGVLWQRRNDDYDPLVLLEGEKSLSFYQKSISSFVASTLTNLAVTPLDVVKVRLQAQEKIYHNNNNNNNSNNNVNNKNNNVNNKNNNLNNNNNSVNNKNINNNMNNNNIRNNKNNNNNGNMKSLLKASNRPVGDSYLLNDQPRFTSTLNTFRTIIRTEGVASLWAGIWPSLLISIPVTILYFPLYDKVKYLLGYDERDESTKYIPPLAGMLCRTGIVIIFNPLELYRTKLQSTKLTLPQLLEASKVSFQQIGPKFLFFGTSAALLRDVPFSAIYWFLYERIKSERLKKKKTTHTQPIDSLIAGGLAGSAAAAVTVPFDVVKTHWQIELGSAHVSATSSNHMIRKLWAERGFQGLFAGFVPRLIRVTPACAIMITVYETLKSLFTKYNVVPPTN